MNSAIVPYIFESHEIRVQLNADGAVWFNANDVCKALEFGNPWQAIESHVDKDDLQKLEAIDTLGRTQQTNHINESGIYALILGSTKESAKRFKRWVTSEVLPTIRKTGSYSVPRFYDQGSETIFRMLLAADEAKHRLDQVERRLLQVEGTREEFVSISGWGSLRSRKLSRQQATIMGRVAAKQCRLRGIDPGTVIHPAFGRVNTYPLDLLDELFG